MGKYMMQAPVYRPPRMKEIYGEYFNNENELTFHPKKIVLHHWALVDLPLEFKYFVCVCM